MVFSLGSLIVGSCFHMLILVMVEIYFGNAVLRVLVMVQVKEVMQILRV